MNIYILVKVDYDYYRFQENVFASTDHDEVIKYYKDKRYSFPLLDGYKEEVQREMMDSNETEHYWVQTL
jgi:hypothetical protein